MKLSQAAFLIGLSLSFCALMLTMVFYGYLHLPHAGSESGNGAMEMKMLSQELRATRQRLDALIQSNSMQRSAAADRAPPTSVPTIASTASLAQQQVQQQTLQDQSEPYFHFVFNTDCVSYKSQWISVAIVHSFMKSQLPSSRLTELISCNRQNFEPAYLPMTRKDKRIRFHIAPLWSPHPQLRDEYPPYNKPKSMMDWLARGDDKPPDHAVIVVVDPDMLLLRAFDPDFLSIVRPGIAMANYYGFGSTWMDGIIGQLCPKCKGMSQTVRDSYIIGTPVLMKASDMRRVSPLWLSYTERIRNDPAIKEKAGWIAEMYGYVLATIETDVRHEARKSLMVTNGEYDIEFPAVGYHYVIHYCQSYEVGSYKFNKHDHHQKDWLSCSEPLFPRPPPKVSGNFNSRTAWMAYTINTMLNEAVDAYKTEVCPKWAAINPPEQKYNAEYLRRNT